jgi:hypothetical protein
MHYNLIIFLLALLLVCLLLSSCVQGRKIEEKFEQEIDFVDRGLIFLENTNGAIRVESWDKSTVKIVALKKVRGGSYRQAEEFLKEVKINIRQFSNELRISADYPRQDSFSGFFSLFTGSGKPGVTITYELTVPKNAELELETTNGAINVANITENIRAKTTNGSVELVNISGNLVARTTNGSLVASFAAIQFKGEIEMRTTNGRIEIELPDSVSAQLSARTTNGKISTDFPVKVQGRFETNKIEGTIGGGDGRIDLRTTNGSVTIRSR